MRKIPVYTLIAAFIATTPVHAGLFGCGKKKTRAATTACGGTASYGITPTVPTYYPTPSPPVTPEVPPVPLPTPPATGGSVTPVPLPVPNTNGANPNPPGTPEYHWWEFWKAKRTPTPF